MRTADEVLKTYENEGDYWNAGHQYSRQKMLLAMEEYANECVKAECTIPVVSGSLPLASEIEAKKNELYSQWKNPYTDEELNHNDNMERYRKGFDSAIEWIVSRALESNDR